MILSFATVKITRSICDIFMGASKNFPHGESTESFPPELCSEIVTKILRRG